MGNFNVFSSLFRGVTRVRPGLHLMQTLFRTWHLEPGLQDKLGYHVKPFRRTSPIPNRFELDMQKVHEKRNLPFLSADVLTYKPILEDLHAYQQEILELGSGAARSNGFYFKNTWYEDVDAAVLYAMIRRYKPRKIIEIGCGYSSLVIKMAVNKNEQKEGLLTYCTHIDPEPRLNLEHWPDKHRFIHKPLQEVDANLAPGLQKNDLLFIDSSHILKTQSDVLHLLMHWLPTLAKGVLIHFHDIFSPYEYPLEFMLETCHLNEQYALESVLANSSRYELILPLYQIFMENKELLSLVFDQEMSRPSGFWLSVGQNLD